MPALPPSQFQQEHYRFFEADDAPGSETPIAAEDTPAEFPVGESTPFMVYLQIADQQNGGTSTSSGTDNQLQYRVNGGTWTNVNGSSSYVRSVASPHFTDDDECPDVGLTNTFNNPTHYSLGLDDSNGVPSQSGFNGDQRGTAGFSLTTVAGDIELDDVIELQLIQGAVTIIYTRYPEILIVEAGGEEESDLNMERTRVQCC